MEKYSKAVSEMYAQFKKREDHPLEKFIGRLAKYGGEQLEVVGYNNSIPAAGPTLIVDAAQSGGWSALEPFDVVFKECEYYWYASIDDLID